MNGVVGVDVVVMVGVLDSGVVVAVVGVGGLEVEDVVEVVGVEVVVVVWV